MGGNMANVSGAHLVGSVLGTSAEDVFTKVSAALPGRLRRLPDGETGERNYWIGFQVPRLLAVPGISQGAPKAPEYGGAPSLSIAPGTKIPGAALGYSEAAAASWQVFERLQSAGIIDPGVLFQVSLPTPFAVTGAWGEFGANQAWMDAYKPALFEEIATICRAIPHDKLSIQIDVAVEIGVLVGVFPADGAYKTIETLAAEIAETLNQIPAEVSRGTHYCFGDYGHRHFKQPENLELAVQMANLVQAKAPSAFLHFPADRDSGLSPDYYSALKRLNLSGAELALGVIDYEGDPARTDALIAAAAAGYDGGPFAVAAECGLSRIGERGEGSIEKHLAEHARVSEKLQSVGKS